MPVELVRPTSAINSAWSTPTVTLIDDVVSEPSAGSGDNAYHFGDGGPTAQQWALGAPSNSGTITSAKLWVRLKFDSNSDGSVSGVRIRFNGTWYSGTLVNQPSSGAYGWASCTITGSYGALSGSAPAFELSYSGATPDGEIYVDVAYLDITYTAGPAERWAVATGNWSSTSTWNGGTLPAEIDDVYANGFTVTVDSNRTASTVRTTAGTTAVAGGGFTLSNGVTLTLTGAGGNVIAGSSNCVTYSGSSGNSATLVGNPAGSATTGSRHGAANTSTGTFNVTGNPTGGSTASSYGVTNTSTGTINVTGNPTGGSNTSSHGAFNASSGRINVTGTPTGGSGSSAAGVANQSTGTIEVTGSTVGGSVANANGALNSSSGTITISTNATGGSNATAYGASNTGTGTLIVNGKAISATAPGVFGGASAITQVKELEVGSSCIAPVEGKCEVIDLLTATAIVRNAALTQQTLTAGVTKNVFAPPSVFGGVA